LDAETRLTSGASSTYFGASGGASGDRQSAVSGARPSMTEDEDAKVKAVLAKLSRVDRRLAEAQEYCPVLESSRLGSMGPPVKVLIQGQPVFLCCEGCVDEARAHPQQTLAKARELKARNGKGASSKK